MIHFAISPFQRLSKTNLVLRQQPVDIDGMNGAAMIMLFANNQSVIMC